MPSGLQNLLFSILGAVFMLLALGLMLWGFLEARRTGISR